LTPFKNFNFELYIFSLLIRRLLKKKNKSRLENLSYNTATVQLNKPDDYFVGYMPEAVPCSTLAKI
jgi:hypothetical protein